MLAIRPRIPNRISFYSALSMAIFLVHILTDTPKISPTFIDFAIFYAAAKFAVSGQVLAVYDIDLLNKSIEFFTGYINNDIPLAWLYQPYVLLFFMPLVFLPYKYALFIWMLSGISIYLFCAYKYIDRKDLLIPLLGFPGFWYNFLWGQQSYFLTGLIGLAFYYLNKKPLLSSFLLSIALVKPHLVASCFLLLLFMRKWKVVCTTIFFYISYIVVSLLVFPVSVWPAYKQSINWITETILLSNNLFISINLSVYNMFKFAGYENTLSLTLQTITSCLALYILHLCWKNQATDITLKLSALFITCLLTTPYTLQYDFALIGLPIIFYYNHALRYGWIFVYEKMLLCTMWILPIISLFIVIFQHVQITPVVLFISLIGVYRRINYFCNH